MRKLRLLYVGNWGGKSSSGLQLMAVRNFMNMTFRSRNSNENGNLNSYFCVKFYCLFCLKRIWQKILLKIKIPFFMD